MISYYYNNSSIVHFSIDKIFEFVIKKYYLE